AIKKQWLFAVGLFLLLFSIYYYCCYWGIDRMYILTVLFILTVLVGLIWGLKFRGLKRGCCMAFLLGF
ncbi:MAG: hypothetical protein KAQ99_10340, partial [Candidatus Aureabacteria bacterium]|nr:hypothetical protein [Candidatus Auribacterota bacterium]